MLNHKNIIKNFILKNWFTFFSIFPIIATLLAIPFIDFSWENNFYKKTLIISLFCYGFVGVVLWIIFNHSRLFQKGQWLRNTIIIVASCAVLLWTYKQKITLRIDILLLFLIGLHGLINRKWIKPNLIIISFLAFLIFKGMGLLWSENIAYSWVKIEEEMFILLLFLPLISLGFRVNQKEKYAFISMCFKCFLLLLTCNFIFYAIYIDFLGNNLFDFFTLNKGYMDYYQVLSWSHFKHPSFISWVFLLVGGLGVFVHKKERNLISITEIILYAILLLFFVFIVQSRIGILGYFIAVISLVWFHFNHRLSIKQRNITMLVGGALMLMAIFWLTTKTSYFSDPIRNNTFQIIKNQLSNQNLIFGGGTATQRLIMKDTGIYHVHNDFISILIDLGILGLALFLFWIVSILKTGNYVLQYTILIFSLIMNTDVLFCFYSGTYIVIPFILFIFFADIKKNNKATY